MFWGLCLLITVLNYVGQRITFGEDTMYSERGRIDAAGWLALCTLSMQASPRPIIDSCDLLSLPIRRISGPLK